MTRIIIQFGRSRIIIGLIIGIGMIMGYMSYSQADDPTLEFIGSDSQSKNDLESFKSFRVDFSILEDERYRALEIYGENPVDPGIVGEMNNPFTPLGE